MEKLKADTAVEPEKFAQRGVGQDSIASMSKGDLRRFIINLLQSEPGVIPPPKKE